jgi:hypothetical protein
MPLRAFLTRCKTKPLILAVLGLCSCGSGFRSLPVDNLGSSVGVLYSIDSLNHRVLRYTPNELGTATLVSFINLPSTLTATLVTTDAAGNLYIGGYTTNDNRSEVLSYDADATDDDAPKRSLKLHPGKLTALAVDRQSMIYAAEKIWAGGKISQAAIYIYSAISGEDIPLRTINPAASVEFNDLAVDSAGRIYVSGSNGSATFIREFSAAATGAATAMRTLWAPHGSAFGGIAVDDNGNLFVLRGTTICELAAGSNGTPEPVQTINLPARFMSYTQESFSNVLRRDGMGDFFVPATMTGADGSVNMVYGFASDASGNATPVIQFTAPDATASAPNGESIPLAVF